MSLEEQLADAVRQGNIPHAVVFASSRDGNFEYSYAVGKTSVEEGASDIQQDALFLLASQTKLVTAVAALQVVERGLIGLDDDVAALLPELARQPILKGFDDDDKPVLEERKARITLSNLLTHTAGTAYDAGNPDLIKFQSQRGIVPNSGLDVVSRFAYPLVYEPGEAWGYSTGIDWAGLVVERLTNSTLETFMKANIWDPLGLQSMTFFPSQRKGEEDRVPVLSARGPDGQLHPHKGPFINTGVTGCFGGSGMYSTMRDYLTFMQSLLVNDGKLLKPESVDELFKPRLTATQAKAHQEFSLSPMGKFFIGEFDWEKYKHGWSFGGLVFLQAYDDGRRREGAITWGGMANSFWLLDREAGLAITFGTQVIPPGDVGVRGAISLVEKGVYAMAGKSQTTISGRM